MQSVCAVLTYCSAVIRRDADITAANSARRHAVYVKVYSGESSHHCQELEDCE